MAPLGKENSKRSFNNVSLSNKAQESVNSIINKVMKRCILTYE